jgi:type I restriction enzyme S subunit
MSTGYVFKSPDYTPQGVFVFRVTNVKPDGSITKNDAVFMPADKITPQIERFYLNEGDILVVMVGGSLGKTGVVTADVLPALLNQNMWRIQPVTSEFNRQYRNCGRSSPKRWNSLRTEPSTLSIRNIGKLRCLRRDG